MGQSQLISRLLKDELKAAATYAAIQIATRFGGYVALPFYWAKLSPETLGTARAAQLARMNRLRPFWVLSGRVGARRSGSYAAR